MDKTTISSLGSVLSAFLASICCIGPVVFSLVGVSSLGLALALEPYRPYLIALTLIFLAIGFYFAYRKREVQCEDGTCRVESSGRWNKILLWIATILALIFIFFPKILTIFN